MKSENALARRLVKAFWGLVDEGARDLTATRVRWRAGINHDVEWFAPVAKFFIDELLEAGLIKESYKLPSGEQVYEIKVRTGAGKGSRGRVIQLVETIPFSPTVTSRPGKEGATLSEIEHDEEMLDRALGYPENYADECFFVERDGKLVVVLRQGENWVAHRMNKASVEVLFLAARNFLDGDLSPGNRLVLAGALAVMIDRASLAGDDWLVEKLTGIAGFPPGYWYKANRWFGYYQRVGEERGYWTLDEVRDLVRREVASR